MVLAGRFRVEAMAGQGGMGTIYRAQDLSNGQPVALKLLATDPSPENLRRFNREAQLLASLSHPGIVSHVAHGMTQEDQPFLVMQWLEGEDLARRLTRQPLLLSEVLALLYRVAEALAVAHQHGIVHRDVKPSNLFLRQGAPGDVVLLDFGLARHIIHSRNVTASGALFGSLGYMAPEQVSAQSQITPAADIFSLGCVLYECLTGQAPFSAPHYAAVLAKLLFFEPAPLQSLCPELPEPLLHLAHRMLAKEASKRFADARELLTALRALGPLSETSAPTAIGSSSPELLSQSGQQLVSILLAAPDQTLTPEPEADLARRISLRDSLGAGLTPHGGTVELLADGTLAVALMLHRGAATDQAAVTARCALSIKERWPEASLVVATGRGVLGSRMPSGEVMDRAGQLLLQLEQLPADSASEVLLDEVTAGLLGPSFQIAQPRPGLFLLQGELLSVDASRPLLGRPTPCVGREQELALLELALNICQEEPVAQAMLVTGSAGMGKSRLRREFLLRLERQGRRMTVLFGRGDPMGGGTAGGLLGQALRQLCGITEGEAAGEQERKLRQRLARHLPPGEAPGVISSLAEMCGVSSTEQAGFPPRGERGDPKILSAQLSRALQDFFRAECRQGPVLLVLEDLHWGDVFSVRRVEELLHALLDQPLMVLAFARPEVHELFPRLWSHSVKELTLRLPGRKACARLIHEVLGESVAETDIDHLIEQSAGNMLFLEELIRGVAEGRGERAPETVLVMLQARLSRLEAEERQALLAASIFGRNFWLRGVGALLQQEGSLAATPYLFQRLVEKEIIEKQPASRFPGEVEYRFRHVLMRDAAYALVSNEYKPRGHRLAGAWLEEAGARDPRVLAGHAALGQQPERAARFYTLAAEQLSIRHDFSAALKCVDAALALGPDAGMRSRLRAVQATAAFWGDDPQKLDAIAREVLPELRVGSIVWCKLVGGLITIKQWSGALAEAALLAEKLWQATPEEDARAAYLEAVGFLCLGLTYTGARAQALAWLERMAEIGDASAAGDAAVRAWLGYANGFAGYHLEARPWHCLSQARQSCEAFAQLGWEYHIGPQVTEGLAWVALGDVSEGLRVLSEGLTRARQLGEPLSLSFARSHRALVLSGLPQREHQEEALALALEERDSGASSPIFHFIPSLVQARIALARGELAEAEAHARKASEQLFPCYLLLARTVLSSALRAQGRLAEARQCAELGCEVLERMGGAGAAAVGMYLSLAETCFAQGEAEAAEAPLKKALQYLHARAEDIPDAALRERFLHEVPENARALQLARQLGKDQRALLGR
jgi:tetratricopeptide (TPR) repeat protein